jgi:hypothetical protein
MNYNETKKVLEDFAREVIKGAKKNLRKRKASGKLSRSLKSDVKVNPNSFELDFEMEGYGAYQDAGVDGKKKRYGKRKAGLPTFKYTTKMPPPKSLDKWVVRKGLKGVRDAKGKFTKRQSLTFIIARSIFMKGLEPTYFFTDAFEAAYKNLPKAFIDKYELDIDNFLKFTTK